MLPRKSEDAPEEYRPEPCAVCGRPSGCAVWGFRLCYGPADRSRVGCAARLSEVLPCEGEKEFTTRWVAEQKAKGRAA